MLEGWGMGTKKKDHFGLPFLDKSPGCFFTQHIA
jgi:hypothetical protein